MLSVDEDIDEKLSSLNLDDSKIAVETITKEIINGNKIYVYGCGATGRLAK